MLQRSHTVSTLGKSALSLDFSFYGERKTAHLHVSVRVNPVYFVYSRDPRAWADAPLGCINHHVLYVWEVPTFQVVRPVPAG